MTRLITCLTLLALGAACSTKSLQQDQFLQGDAYASDYPYRHVLLVGLDPETRTKLENDLRGRVASGGTQAVASHKTWKKVVDIERERELKTFLDKYEIEAVITVALVDAKSPVKNLSDSAIVATMEAGWNEADVPGEFLVEVVVWDARDFLPIWVGRSEVFSKKQRKKYDEFADFTIQALQDRDLIYSGRRR